MFGHKSHLKLTSYKRFVIRKEFAVIEKLRHVRKAVWISQIVDTV